MPVLPERLVSPATDAMHPSQSSTVQLTNGGWVTVWFATSDNWDTSVSAQVFDETGAMVGDRIVLKSATDLSAATIDVVARPNGGWTVHWSLYDDNMAVNSKAYYRSFDSAGTLTAAADHDGPERAFEQKQFADGSFLVGGFAFGHSFVRTDFAGTILATYDNPPIEHTVSTSDFDILSDGGWVATWWDVYTSKLSMQRYDSDGELLGDPVLLDSNPWTIENYVTALNDGGWLVRWRDFNGNDFLSRYDADGDTIVDSRPVEYQFGVTVFVSDTVALDDGGWMTAYGVYDGTDTDQQLIMQRYAADGTAFGEPVTFGSSHGMPDLTKMDDGGWLVTWPGYNDGWYGVYQQRIDSAGNLIASNTPPEGGDQLIVVREDKHFIFDEDNFPFKDFNGNDFAGVTITNFVGRGSFLFNGVAVESDVFVSAEDLATGKLTWTPFAEEYGTSYASLDFYVHDNGGTDHGGRDDDSVSNTLTFDVRQIRDKITGTDRKDRLVGTDFGDLINGGAGNDWLRGKGGDDEFSFSRDHGKDIITDFAVAEDVIKLKHVPFSFAHLRRYFMEERGDDVIVHDHTRKFPGDMIILRDVDLDDLTSHNFYL